MKLDSLIKDHHACKDRYELKENKKLKACVELENPVNTSMVSLPEENKFNKNLKKEANAALRKLPFTNCSVINIDVTGMRELTIVVIYKLMKGCKSI